MWGIFGKIPASSDFIGRGLPYAARARWDRWISAHLAFALSGQAIWPESGLRFSTHGAYGVLMDSRDRIGRRFPLLIVRLHENGIAEPASADELLSPACSAVVCAVRGEMGQAELWAALETVDSGPPSPMSAPEGTCFFWSSNTTPMSTDWKHPRQALTQILDSASKLM